ncbi:Trypsin domain containing protein [Trichuris trichiura]|uniref:Trypsin domain containing protein n=1 Tax=Trichuris trichiura TaxID=36087 RepID=A0A077ZCD9_TRITR|nr:Trypsin domain containing protein [Trichuris trichiura]
MKSITPLLPIVVWVSLFTGQVDSFECGYPRAHGGLPLTDYIQPKSEHTFPWTVAIIRTYGRYLCLGSVVNEDTRSGKAKNSTTIVLTAGNCFRKTFGKSWGKPSRYAVVAGIQHYSLFHKGYKRRAEYIRIVQFKTGGNDRIWDGVAAVYLRKPLVFGKFVSPVCLAFPHFVPNQHMHCLVTQYSRRRFAEHPIEIVPGAKCDFGDFPELAKAGGLCGLKRPEKKKKYLGAPLVCIVNGIAFQYGIYLSELAVRDKLPIYNKELNYFATLHAFLDGAHPELRPIILGNPKGDGPSSSASSYSESHQEQHPGKPGHIHPGKPGPMHPGQPSPPCRVPHMPGTPPPPPPHRVPPGPHPPHNIPPGPPPPRRPPGPPPPPPHRVPPEPPICVDPPEPKPMHPASRSSSESNSAQVIVSTVEIVLPNLPITPIQPNIKAPDYNSKEIEDAFRRPPPPPVIHFTNAINQTAPIRATCGDVSLMENKGKNLKHQKPGLTSFPWDVLITTKKRGAVRCLGSLVHQYPLSYYANISDLVVTAGYCFHRLRQGQWLDVSGRYAYIAPGKHSFWTRTGIKREIEGGYSYPIPYGTDYIQDGIALLKLKQPVPLGEHAQAVCLPERNSLPSPQAVCFYSRFYKSADRIYNEKVPLASTMRCFQAKEKQNIEYQGICTLEQKKRGAVQLGSPLVCYDQGRLFQYGVYLTPAAQNAAQKDKKAWMGFYGEMNNVHRALSETGGRNMPWRPPPRPTPHGNVQQAAPPPPQKRRSSSSASSIASGQIEYL